MTRPPPPGRPRVVVIGDASAELEWPPPELTAQQRLASAAWTYQVSLRVDGVGTFVTCVEDTLSGTTRVMLNGLEPSTWYEFRVAAVDPVFGVGATSAPSKPAATHAPRGGHQRALGVRGEASSRLVPPRPPLPEVSSHAAAEASLRLECAELRLAVLRWDSEWSAARGRPPTNDERARSEARGKLLSLLRLAEEDRRALARGDLSGRELSALWAVGSRPHDGGPAESAAESQRQAAKLVQEVRGGRHPAHPPSR